MFRLGSDDWRERMPSRAILDACDAAGMRWAAEHVPHGVAWSGERQTAYLRGCDDWEAAHELAHWLLAPPERRRLDEFGGGPSQFTQDGQGADLPVVLHGTAALEDEQLAQALTVAILVACGQAEGGLRRYNTWHMGTLALDWAELRRRGLLTPGNVPVFLGDDGRVLAVPGPQRVNWLPEGSTISWWPAGCPRKG